jgi:hypothetical protein
MRLNNHITCFNIRQHLLHNGKKHFLIVIWNYLNRRKKDRDFSECPAVRNFTECRNITSNIHGDENYFRINVTNIKKQVTTTTEFSNRFPDTLRNKYGKYCLYFDLLTIVLGRRKSILCILYSNIMSFFHFVDKGVIYQLGIISLAHAPVHVTDFSVINVHVDELSSARIWQHKLCSTFSASVNINYRLPIKVYCRIDIYNLYS